MNVLVVDDDTALAEDLAVLLRMEGFQAETASDGRAALERLRQGVAPCLILLDLMMPVMSGWDFRAAQLADPRLADIPVLVLSGASDLAEQASGLRAAGYLRKPVDFDLLFRGVQRHCR